ncbi:hypothetical protein ACQPW3_13515 [Actinosynnema sp. CA-248983]
MGSLWIGPLGRLREIPDRAAEFDRSISLGVSEFAALGGGVTTTRLATPPRRMTLSWPGLPDDDARWLEALARRVFGPGPLAVLDPTSRNLLEGGQSQGVAPRSMIGLVGFGTLTEQPDRTLTVTDTQAGSQLFYLHSHWGGWPVVTGLTVSFTSALTDAGAVCLLDFFDAAGTFVGGSDPAPVTTTLPPAEAVVALPKVTLPTLTTPTPVGTAILRVGEPITPGEPAPIGDGCPAMTVTAYTDQPRYPNRGLSLTLVEVRRARS